MVNDRLWWRWSWRDLRGHWAAVATIAAVIAIGTGVYAGLGSTAAWRRESNDLSFAELRMHDLRAALSPGTFAESGDLRAAAMGIEHAGWIERVDERLIVDSSLDASAGGEVILVMARLVGGPYDDPEVLDDRWVEQRDSDGPVLELKFADYYGLPASGTVELAGGDEVEYTGLGVAPEELYVLGPEGSILAQADLATLYLTLTEAQRLTGHADAVNDVVLSLAASADRDVVEAELQAALDVAWSATVTTRDEAEAFRILYEDIDNDQQLWNALSALVLGAAALASFNLISRIVESQRREIGIGMALGVTRWRLAIRPVLVGVQVGLIGTAAGIGVAALLGAWMRGLMESLIPMPIWVMPFQLGVFVQGASFGLVPPVMAAVIPVWRAVRVEPIEAIRSGHLARVGGRLGGWARRLRVPGGSLAQMPLRNLLRAPRRTVLTALGVGAAITALVAVLGMLDSFEGSIARGAAEVTKGDPERVTLTLDGFQATDAATISAILASPAVGTADLSLRVPATVGAPGHDAIDVAVEILDVHTAVWTPTITGESADGAATGLYLAEKAARDLGVGVGDMVTLTHPQRVALGFAMVATELAVTATHPNPIRTVAYLDASFADSFGLAGFTNVVQVTPADGSLRGDVQRAVFGIDGVASAQPVGRVGEVFDEAMAQFTGLFAMTAGAVLLLALLIAFNSARISVDERRREHATMLAFGLRVRDVIGVLTREAVVVGVLATIVGAVAGTAVLQWMLDSLAARTLPDFDITREISATTVAASLLVGVASVSIAPLFLVRRIRRMDLPDTLRVME